MFKIGQIVSFRNETAFVVTPGSAVTEVEFPGNEHTTWLPTVSLQACIHEHNSLGRTSTGRLTSAHCLRCDEDTTELVVSRGTRVQI